MLYHYLASDKNNRVREGDMDAASLNQVLQFLSANELRPVSVRVVRTASSGWRLFFDKINLTDKIFLTRYLSLMLKVGTDLLSAINILIADFEKPAMKNFLIEVRENLSKGQPFYQAFARHPKVFSPVFINLVRVAEVSGNLQQTFSDLSDQLQKEDELRKKIRSAMIYPIILLVVAVSIFTFLSLFALPRIAKVFLESGINPPTFSKFVFTVGLFFGDHAFLILVTFIGIIAGAIYFFFKNSVGRRLGRRISARLPVVNRVFRDLAIQRFAATFGALLKAGMPIVQATKITAEVVGMEEIRVSLNRIADEGLSKGLTVGEAFKRETVFPTVITNLIAISEKAGHLEEVLVTVADFYGSNVNSSIQSLVNVLEPLLLLGMGLLVGSIAMAIIVPIYQLTSNF